MMDVLKLLSAVAVRSYDISVTYQAVLIGYESFKAYRASGVDLGCSDTYLCAKPVTETVSKSCRAIYQNAS